MAVKHRYMLVNEQGCVFDRGMFSNVKDAKAWARGRGGTYKLIREVDDMPYFEDKTWIVRNNRIYEW